VGAIASIFTSPAVAVVVAGVLAAPAVYLLLMRSWSYKGLVLATMIVMSNLFLVHRVIALHSPNGDDIFGIRDVLLIATLGIGFYTGHRRLRQMAFHPLVWPGIAIALLLPSAALWGITNGANGVVVAREAYTLAMWLFPLIIAANIGTAAFFRLLYKALVVLGVLVAIGVILEVGSSGALHLVSTIRQSAANQLLTRVFPDGWVFMIFAVFSSFVEIIAKRNVPRECAVFFLNMTAIVLTLQRGMLFTTIGGMGVLTLFVAMRGDKDLRAGRVAVPAVLLLLVGAGFVFAVSESSPFLNRWLTTRYLDAQRDLGGRSYELKKVGEVFEANPVAGTGLGVAYRDPLPGSFALRTQPDDGTFCHNIVGYLLVKMGLPGALAFLAFCFAILVRLWRYAFAQYPLEVRRYGLALSTALFVLLVLAQSDNVFGDIRTLPVCGIGVGMLVGLERLQTSAAGGEWAKDL
jgi:O-antigen ligase